MVLGCGGGGESQGFIPLYEPLSVYIVYGGVCGSSIGGISQVLPSPLRVEYHPTNFLQQLMENYTQLCSSIASQHIPKMTAEGSF